MNLETKVAGIDLRYPWMNGAGTCKTLEDVGKLADPAVPVGAIMVGSITMAPREGNPGVTYYADHSLSINSKGLPNPGAPYYCNDLPLMAKLAHDNGKKLFVSVAGFSPDEYARLARLAFDAGADLVELNLSCPNVLDGGAQKSIACFSRSAVVAILQRVQAWIGLQRPVSLKISPFSDPEALIDFAGTFVPYQFVKAITAINTFANGLVYGCDWNPVIDPNGGLGGIGGPAIKPLAHGTIYRLRPQLPKTIDLIGVGGIQYRKDVEDFRIAGAAAVQICTAYLEEGAVIFQRLLDEFAAT